MQEPSNTDEPSARVLADLSALADGTLDPAREQAVREMIASSAELRARYERERRAIAALHATRADRAPEELRARIEAQRRAGRRPVRRRLYGGAMAFGLAAVVLALVLLLPQGAPGGPSVSQAAALALRGPALPPPSPDPSHPSEQLSREVQEVYFPNWRAQFKWWPAGMRVDHFANRTAVTVFYADPAKRQIAYTIVTAPALRWPGSQTRVVDGTAIQSLRLGDRLVITWRRADHTCVLSATGVSWNELARLAAWRTTTIDGQS